jgi:hypothetical protein
MKRLLSHAGPTSFRPAFDDPHVRAGLVLALLWLGAALPDLIATFTGDRPTNDISFSPAWLKALRDLFTLTLALRVCRETHRVGSGARAFALAAATFYAATAISRGVEPAVAIRGVVWLVPLVWAWTTNADGATNLVYILRSAMGVLIPAGIVSSLVLGLAGADMYFEWIGPYQRNPGLFLSPSATAFVACASYLLAAPRDKWARWRALTVGALSVSGIFYLYVALFFGRLPKFVYAALGIALISVLAVLGIDGIISLAVEFSSGLREGSSVNATLGARILIFADALDSFSLVGNYPLGLNVAANNDIEQFFPDNAYLAAAYAFGVVGILTSAFVTIHAATQRRWSLFLLLLTGGMFYVWFENSLFTLIVGCLLNRHFAARKVDPHPYFP